MDRSLFKVRNSYAPSKNDLIFIWNVINPVRKSYYEVVVTNKNSGVIITGTEGSRYFNVIENGFESSTFFEGLCVFKEWDINRRKAGNIILKDKTGLNDIPLPVEFQGSAPTGKVIIPYDENIRFVSTEQ